MISYGGIFFSLVCLVGIEADPESFWSKTTNIFATIAIGIIVFDALENIFILMTLSDPVNFPDIWALIHSTFALVKFILMVIVVTWLFLGVIVYLINKFKQKEKRN